MFAGATEMKDTLLQVLEKHGFWQAIIMHHVMGSKIYQNLDKKGKKYQLSGSLTTCQTDKQVKFWVGRAHKSRLNRDTFYEDQFKLNLQKNKEGLHEYRGRIQGKYPICLPTDAR